MRKTLGVLTFSGLFFTLACGGRDQASPSQQQYETVQEGSASGVTSTIHGPGETIPPMTGTNADTTSAFTINPALAAEPATTTATATDTAAEPPPLTQTDTAPPAEKPKEEPLPPATETQNTDTQQSDPPPPPA